MKVENYASAIGQQASRSALDMKGLDQIKSAAGQHQEQALAAVAKQFETVFMQMVLQSMKQANDVFKSDLDDSNEMDMYQDMFCQQLSQTIASSSDIGIAKALQAQFAYQAHK